MAITIKSLFFYQGLSATEEAYSSKSYHISVFSLKIHHLGNIGWYFHPKSINSGCQVFFFFLSN